MSVSENESFWLPTAMWEAIVAHARQEWPRECCGLIAGSAGVPAELIPVTNVYPGEDFFEMEPGELYRQYLAIDERGQEIVANYHSHPISPAYPSVRDVAHAGWPEIVYLICSLEHTDAPVIRAFRIEDGTIRELALTVA
jgi:proteasome lid subunit RPN8/RPN11